MNLILFDVSGTLVYSDDFEKKVLWRTLSRVLSIPFSTVGEFRPEETETSFVSKVWKMVNGHQPEKEDWDTIYETYHEELIQAYLASPSRFRPLEGAPELLSHLQGSQSWGFAIATSAWHDLAHLSLRGAGFYTRRFHVVTGEGIHAKADLLNKAIESSGRWYGVQRFDKVIYVGDESLDTVVCAEMKLPFIEVKQLAANTRREKRGLLYPDKTQFIRIARRAVAPNRVKANSLITLMGLKA